LIEQIMAIYRTSDGAYGRPRITVELADLGVRVNHKRVGRLMRETGIKGVSRRRGFVITTHRNKRDRPAPDLVQRHFKATSINQLWVADMTYIPTWVGFLYLATVIDVFSRKVVGWSFGETMTANLVISALNMALITRKPGKVIHHSDPPNIPALSSASDARKWACVLRWAVWVMPMITQWLRAFSLPWNVS